ncbi:hypothetical protein BJ508DRAFT_327869 [Ascobolus immersus RN42]|uniref:Uncharacterized protein n=1 Tax=Ascobolus immersus RN42 TaxID=1160509 RepID=A0A3N4IDK6_ASCIM|nr:hypothetical protein BJ508DRAFT_327869 [Ascobolus immersus RN42]
MVNVLPGNITTLLLFSFLCSNTYQVFGFPCNQEQTGNSLLADPFVAKPVQPPPPTEATIPIPPFSNNTSCSRHYGKLPGELLTAEGYHNLVKAPTSIFSLLAANLTRLPFNMEVVHSSAAKTMNHSTTGNVQSMIFAFQSTQKAEGKAVRVWDTIMVCSPTGKGDSGFNVTELQEADEIVERRCGSREGGKVMLRDGGIYERVGAVGEDTWVAMKAIYKAVWGFGGGCKW